MEAGVDFGSSLTKAVWNEHGFHQYSSTADCPLKKIAYSMAQANVTQINVAGIGYTSERVKEFAVYGMKVKTFEGDPIQNEIRLQAQGVRQLLGVKYQGKEFLLVSVGTGTSYTIVKENNFSRLPMGSPLGGGYINGWGNILGAQNYAELVAEATKGISLDLRVKDLIPEKAGSFEGELVVANFCKATAGASKQDIYATLIGNVATATIQGIMDYSINPAFPIPEDVVYIGSTVSHTPLLKELLASYSLMIGKTPHFPKQGEFALALGAILSED